MADKIPIKARFNVGGSSTGLSEYLTGETIPILHGGTGATTPAGALAALGGGGGGHVIQEEGVDLTQRANLNFIGAGVTATDDVGNDATKVTITPTGASIPFIKSDGVTSDPIDLTSAALGESLVSDITPQLGGNLDVNGQSIVSVSNGDISILPNGIGNVVLDGLNWPQADGTVDYVLKTNGAGQLSWTAGGAGTITALNNAATNELVTVGTITTELDGEANLTFDGSRLAVGGDIVVSGANITAKTTEDAKKVMLVDLTDPSTMWDVQKFLAHTRHTSWRTELGVPPMHGAIWLDEAAAKIVWWDIDTDTEYMQFNSGGIDSTDANMIYLGAVTDINFLDGVLYLCTNGGGVWIVDFMKDDCVGHFASGQRIYNGNINQRDGGLGNVETYTNQLPSNDVRAIVAVRDPNVIDIYGRKLHWWAAATGLNGASVAVKNPINDAIYDIDGGVTTGLSVSSDGWLWVLRDYTSPNYLYRLWKIFDVNVDGFAYTVDLENGGIGGVFDGRSGMASALATPSSSIAYEGGSALADTLLIMGEDEGLTFRHLDHSDYTNSGVIFVNSTYQSPYTKGLRTGTWPLHDISDVSGYTHDLTNNGVVTFTAGVFGNAATFDGTAKTLKRTADTSTNIFPSGVADATISCYFKGDSTLSNVDQSLISWYHSTPGTPYISLAINPSNALRFVYQDDSGGASNKDLNQTAGAVINDDRWHHVVGRISGTEMSIWLDGERGGVLTITTGGTFTLNEFTIGGEGVFGATAYFKGQIDMVSAQEAAWTDNEISFEYNRMKRSLGGAVHTLGAADVDNISIDPNTGLLAVCVNNQVEIWDSKMGLRESIDAVNTAVLNDADLRLELGADNPLYISGRSGQIDVVSPQRRVMG